MRNAANLLVAQIAQQRAAGLPVRKAAMKGAQVCRECGNMMVVIRSILPKCLTVQLSSRPRPVKGMAEQVVFGNTLMQLVEKLMCIHSFLQ